jgi:hypothetical protein
LAHDDKRIAARKLLSANPTNKNYHEFGLLIERFHHRLVHLLARE